MAIVTTTHGDMDDSLLVKKEGGFEDDNECTTWVEYWLGEELVHRSANVNLKLPVAGEAIAANFG